MLRGNPPPPPPNIPFFLFLSISFPSLFKKKSENFGGGLNPLNPPLKYALVSAATAAAVAVIRTSGINFGYIGCRLCNSEGYLTCCGAQSFDSCAHKEGNCIQVITYPMDYI